MVFDLLQKQFLSRNLQNTWPSFPCLSPNLVSTQSVATTSSNLGTVWKSMYSSESSSHKDWKPGPIRHRADPCQGLQTVQQGPHAGQCAISVNTHSNTMFNRNFTTDLEDFTQPGTGVLHRQGCASAHLLRIWPEMNWVNCDGSRLNQSLTLQCNPCASDQLSTAKLELCFSDKGPRNALKPVNGLVHFSRLDLQNTETTDCTSIKVN